MFVTFAHQDALANARVLQSEISLALEKPVALCKSSTPKMQHHHNKRWMMRLGSSVGEMMRLKRSPTGGPSRPSKVCAQHFSSLDPLTLIVSITRLL